MSENTEQTEELAKNPILSAGTPRFGDGKLNMNGQINSSMTVHNTEKDEHRRSVENIGGK